MIVTAIQFTKPIPVFGTGRREEHFEAKSGWRIDIQGAEVVLSREASTNVPAVEAYRVVGEGFCIPGGISVGRDGSEPRGETPEVAGSTPAPPAKGKKR